MAIDNKAIDNIGPRTAFLLPNTGGIGREHEPHLHVCVTAPDKDGNVLCVPIGSHQEGMDTTCILDKGDHDYITRKSIVYYGHAKIKKSKLIIDNINSKNYEHWEDVKQDVFSRVTKGVLSSTHMKPALRSYARLQWS